MTERLQTTKDKISRLLIINAQAKGQKEEWNQLMRRHLEDIDRSDPDMCMQYGVFLFKRGDDMEETIRWANVALENKHTWSGKTYVSRVNNLLRLRAEAAYRIWNDAEKRMVETTDRERKDVRREYRGWAMDNAREWLDYVQSSGLDNRKALQLCLAAAGHRGFCSPR